MGRRRFKKKEGGGIMAYVVKATIGGRRIASQVYQNKSDAQSYATRTNRDRQGANARVKKV